MSKSLTQARLLEILRPDFTAGRFTWVSAPRFHPEVLGRDAGAECPHHSGKSYVVIKIDGKAYRRGRLMFLAAYGRWPAPCLDHINGDSLDDRLTNLREATVMQNSWNHKRRAKTTALPMGVRQLKSGRFQARIARGHQTIYLGSFATPDAAAATYAAKRKELFREWA